MRGQHLFEDYFPNQNLPEKQKSVKGRDPDLNDARNELLLHRYFYYGKYTDLRYSAIMTKLCNEFFLSPARVADIIQQNSTTIREIRACGLSREALQKKFPHWNWK